MKLVVLISLVALAAAIPPRHTTKKPIRLLRYSFNQDGRGNYEYGYEQDNGQIVHEIGSSQPGPKPETGTISKEGSYEYVGPDLQTYRIDYVAGEGGFQALGAHLPKAPAQLPEYAQLRQQYPELFVGSTL